MHWLWKLPRSCGVAAHAWPAGASRRRKLAAASDLRMGMAMFLRRGGLRPALRDVVAAVPAAVAAGHADEAATMRDGHNDRPVSHVHAVAGGRDARSARTAL